MKKSIYGLIQAAGHWRKKFMSALREMGLVVLNSDSSLLIGFPEEEIAILFVYVDEVIVMEILKLLTSKFKKVFYEQM